LITEAVITILFAIVGIAVIGWIAFLIPELRVWLRQHASLDGVIKMIFVAEPDPQEVEKSAEPVKIVMKDIYPILIWLLIILPMFIFPIVLVIMPLMHIPWSYLLPPTK
jgi:hypothetical protein